MQTSRDRLGHSAIATLLTLGLGSSVVHADEDDDMSAALRAGDLESVIVALDRGADVDGTGNLAPLYVAAIRGDTEIVKVLLDAGASPNPVDGQGRSALVGALLAQHLDAAATLIESGADVDLAETQPGRSPLQLVIDEAPSLQSMALLLDAGASIDQKDLRGETALASAAFMNRPGATRLLIERGARLDLTNNEGISPLEWARRQGNTDIMDILQAAGMAE